MHKPGWRTLSAVGGLLAALMVLAACGSSSQSPSSGGAAKTSNGSGSATSVKASDIKVATSLVFQAPNQQAIADGGAQAAKEFGASYSTAGPSQFNAPEAIADFKSLVSSGAKGVAVQPYPPTAWTKAVAAAAKQGVTVASLNTPAFQIKNWLYVGANEVTLGREMAALIARGLGPNAHGEVVLTECLSGSTTLSDRNVGIALGLKQLEPGVTVTQRISTQGINPTAVFGDWQRILQTHRNALAYTGVCTTDLPAMIKAKEKSNVKGLLVGVDFSPPTIQAIQKGIVYGSVGQNGYEQGYIAVRALLEHLVHNKPMPVGWLDAGTTPATKDNIASVAALQSSKAKTIAYYKSINDKMFANIASSTKPISAVRSGTQPLPDDIGTTDYSAGG